MQNGFMLSHAIAGVINTNVIDDTSSCICLKGLIILHYEYWIIIFKVLATAGLIGQVTYFRLGLNIESLLVTSLPKNDCEHNMISPSSYLVRGSIAEWKAYLASGSSCPGFKSQLQSSFSKEISDVAVLIDSAILKVRKQ